MNSPQPWEQWKRVQSWYSVVNESEKIDTIMISDCRLQIEVAYFRYCVVLSSYCGEHKIVSIHLRSHHLQKIIEGSPPVRFTH